MCYVQTWSLSSSNYINEKTELKEVNPNLHKATEQVQAADLFTARILVSQSCLQWPQNKEANTPDHEDLNSRWLCLVDKGILHLLRRERSYNKYFIIVFY